MTLPLIVTRRAVPAVSIRNLSAVRISTPMGRTCGPVASSHPASASIVEATTADVSRPTKEGLNSLSLESDSTPAEDLPRVGPQRLGLRALDEVLSVPALGRSCQRCKLTCKPVELPADDAKRWCPLRFGSLERRPTCRTRVI